MTEQMTAKDALEALTRVVKREGRDTVRACYYTRDDERGWPAPHCVVGCVLADKGVSVEWLDMLGSQSISDLYEEKKLGGIIDLSPEAVWVLRWAQRKQDAQYPWGKALATARRLAWRRGIIGKEHPRRRAEEW